MKKNFWMALATMCATAILAQPATTTAPAGTNTGSPAIATPAPAPAVTNVPGTSAPAKTNPPPAKTERKKAVAKKPQQKPVVKKAPAPELRTVPLVAGHATVIASNVNIRGQAKLNSEIISRLQKDQTVTVLEEVQLKKSGPDEPSAWAKIILPDTAKVWVNTKFIDQTNKTVIPKRLKIRAGPGEEYSFIGILKQGDTIKDITNRNDWIQIAAPAEAYGFVAAQYLKQDTNAPVEVAAVTTPATVTEPPAVAPATEPTVPATEPATTTPAETNAVVATTESKTNEAPVAVEEPPKPRIVQREGIVRGTFSIQAPTKYELISLDTHRAINYLHAISPSLDLSRYKGMHIIVTGEEGLDERWHNTPVIAIQRIQVLD